MIWAKFKLLLSLLSYFSVCSRRNCDLRRHKLTHTLGLTEAQTAEQSPSSRHSDDVDMKFVVEKLVGKDDCVDVVN